MQYVPNLDQTTVLIMSMSNVILHVPPGTVCIKCSVGDKVAADAVFIVDNTNINGRIGRVVDGVLVVFDTKSVFTTSSTTDVQCTSDNLTVSHQVVMYLESKSYNTESLII